MDGTPGLVRWGENMKRKEIRNREDGATKANTNGKAARKNGKDRSAHRVSEKDWMRAAVAKVAAAEWWNAPGGWPRAREALYD